MIKKIIFTFVALPSLLLLQFFTFILWIFSFGKIGFVFWERVYNRVIYSTKTLTILFICFLSIDIFLCNLLYLKFTQESFILEGDILNWRDIENTFSLVKKSNNWNWEYSYGSLLVRQQCPSGNANDLYIFNNNKLIAKTHGRYIEEKYVFDIIDTTNNKVTITTTQGKSSLKVNDIFSSMFININDHILGYVKYSSFTMNGFYVRNMNDKPEILFMRRGGWEMSKIVNESEIRLEYMIAFMGNYLLWEDTNKYGVDICNLLNEISSLFMVISVVFLFFSVVILIIFVINGYRNRNQYEIIN